MSIHPYRTDNVPAPPDIPEPPEPSPNAEAIAYSWRQLMRILDALAHFRDPAITVDALRLLGDSLTRDRRYSLTALARRHGISPPAMHRRVVRVGKFLGVRYKA
jgi:hypothetical protein